MLFWIQDPWSHRFGLNILLFKYYVTKKQIFSCKFKSKCILRISYISIFKYRVPNTSETFDKSLAKIVKSEQSIF
jgi:hypothetical protein